MMRIDAHHHLWRFTEEEYGWIGDDMSSLRRDFLLDDLRDELAEASVSGTVAMQARQTVEETRWLLELAGDTSPVLGVVGWLPVADQNFEATLDSFHGNPHLKGLRHVVQTEPDGFLESEAFNRGIATLHARSLVYDILIYARQLPEATRFVDRHPQQTFVLDHIAKPDIRGGGIEAWSRNIRELARRPNVSCKLSGMVTETDWTRWSSAELAPYFGVVLDAFGPRRLMIGTDWPVLTVGCSYARWWQTVESWIAPLSRDEQAQILGETAMRIYNLRVTAAETAPTLHTAGAAA